MSEESKAPYVLFQMCDKTFTLSHPKFAQDRTKTSGLPTDVNSLKIFDAACLATKFFRDVEFAKRTENVIFTYTKDYRVDILRKISDEIVERVTKRNPVMIKAYRTFNPWSAAIAMTKKSEPGVIYINTRKIARRDEADYINTLVHEFMHIVGYSHGSNSPKGKEDSVPYRMGSIAEDWARESFSI